MRAYLDELGLPRHDVHLDLERIRSLSVDVLAALSDDELAARVGVPVEAVAVVRGAHDLVEAARSRAACSTPPSRPTAPQSPETLERFVELREQLPETLDKDAGEGDRARAEGGRRQPARAAASR